MTQQSKHTSLVSIPRPETKLIGFGNARATLGNITDVQLLAGDDPIVRNINHYYAAQRPPKAKPESRSAEAQASFDRNLEARRVEKLFRDVASFCLPVIREHYLVYYSGPARASAFLNRASDIDVLIGTAKFPELFFEVKHYTDKSSNPKYNYAKKIQVAKEQVKQQGAKLSILNRSVRGALVQIYDDLNGIHKTLEYCKNTYHVTFDQTKAAASKVENTSESTRQKNIAAALKQALLNPLGLSEIPTLAILTSDLEQLQEVLELGSAIAINNDEFSRSTLPATPSLSIWDALDRLGPLDAG